VDETTEEFADGETQIWKITHNGVDSHPVHFHLLNVQVINRVGWDGFIQPIEPKEMGWKETVMMSPLEDIIVAVRAKKPVLPGFGVPTSSRLMDPTQPEGSPFGFTQIDPATGNPKVVTNALKDYGWEYVWHCHILGHEENDFMRPVKFNANEMLPGAPQFVTAAPATGGVNVNWSDNSVTEYKFEIQRADATVSVDPDPVTLQVPPPVIGVFAKVGDALANATTFLDSTAAVLTPPVPGTPGQAYAYKVVAIGAAGSAESVAALTPQDMAVPAAPTGLAVTGTSGTQVALQWVDNSNNEAGFLIERSIDGGATWTPLAPVTTLGTGISVNVPQNTTTFVDSGLAPNTAVSYRVSAANIKGQTATTNIADTVTNSAPTVAAVTIPLAAVSSNSVTLNWTLSLLPNALNQGVTGYVITRSGGAGGQATFQVAGNDQTLTWTDLTAAQNSTYTYTVHAVNAAGLAPVNGIAATSNSATTLYAAVGPLGQIGTVASATGVAPTSVTVTWPAASPATNYLLERSADGGATYITLSSVATPPVGGYLDTTVLPLSTYTYRVTATNGNSGTSSVQTASVTTNAAIVVLAPALTASVPNLTAGTATLTLIDLATNETGFVVESSVDGGLNWTAVGAQVASLTGTGLTRAVTVPVTAPSTQFRARALNLTAGVTTYSGSSNVVTVDTVLAQPGTPTATITSTTQIALSWTDNSNNETSFQVWRSVNGAAATQVGTVNRAAALGAATGGAAVTYNDNAVTLGNTYDYFVIAANGNKSSIASATVNVPFVLPTAPAPLAQPAIAVVSATRANVTLTWPAAPAGATYTVRRIQPAALGGGTTTLLANTTATTVTDLNVRRSATAQYTYQIRVNVGPLSSAYVNTLVTVN